MRVSREQAAHVWLALKQLESEAKKATETTEEIVDLMPVFTGLQSIIDDIYPYKQVTPEESYVSFWEFVAIKQLRWEAAAKDSR